MRTASKVLGIIGGILLILSGVLICLIGVMAVSVLDFDIGMEGASNLLLGIYIVWGVLGIVGGVLGIVGGALSRRKNVLGGIFMIAGAAMGFLTIFGFLAAIALDIGGIFALLPDKKATQPQIITEPQPINKGDSL